jgi:hypothetical protein
MSNIILKISAIFLAFFGLISLFMTTSIIFDLFEIREKEGHYIPFIVYANFVCSFIYLFSSYGLFTKNKYTTGCLFVAAGILLIAYIALIVHIQFGGAFELKTVKAMLARTSITILLAGLSWYYISRTKLIEV